MALTKAQLTALRKAAKKIQGGKAPLEQPKKLQPSPQETPKAQVIHKGEGATSIYNGLIYGVPLNGYLDNVNDLPDYPCQ